MRHYVLSETNWKTVKDHEYDLAILPWGATEAHNYHLPYSADIIESDYIAAESAKIAWDKGARLIVLPTIPFGVNTGQKDILLDININPSTQQAILGDVIEGLNRQGIKKLLIFNSHGGNNFKAIVRELGLKYPEMFICFSNWFQSVDKKVYFEAEGKHADEMETSLMLYLKPDLVLPKEKWGKGHEKKNKISAISEGWAWAESRWSQITADTGIGNPAAATKEKGAKYFKAVTEKMAGLLVDLCNADIQNLYA